MTSLRVGVLADTHGLLGDDTLAALAGSDAILHAGDIGDEALLDELRRIAPVVAVVGNGDPELTDRYPWEQRVELGGARILLCHWYDNFGKIHPSVARELADWQPHALVYGHTHEVVNERSEGCLRFNPGYAGPAAPGRRRSVGRLTVQGPAIEGEILWLDPEPASRPGGLNANGP
ncbi:MAG: YfcE family phosphodiesterase [Deltaproteobacteria bacterium]|jgi:hypothetical protein|nr:YfcE family phosphodiesterase [Deltaproteobacteria bacterium]